MPDALFDRVPPHSQEAELSVLGSMLLDHESIGTVLQILRPEHFYSRANQLVYRAILGLFEGNRPVDVLILSEELTRRKELEMVGGLPHLSDVVASVPSAANAEYYAQIVRDKALLRLLLSAAAGINRDVYESEESADRILDLSEHRIFEIAEQKATRESRHIGDIYKEVFERLDNIHDRHGRLTGLATNFYQLDELTCGLQNSELIVLAARPSMGKTSFALNVLEHVAVYEEKAVALFTLEMSAQQVAQNMLCSHCKIESHKLRSGMLSEKEYGKLTLGAGKLSQAQVFVDDSPGLNVLELRAKARRLKAVHDVALIVVDYLQLMETHTRAESRQQQIAEISRGLKSLARELQVPVVALSQLNRAVESREDHKPRMSDLRESGAIEQDADVVILLHRESYYAYTDGGQQQNSPGRPVEDSDIYVVKQRNGPTGNLKLRFFKSIMRFENPSRETADMTIS